MARKPAQETLMIPATTDDCPMTEECPGYDRDRGACLVLSGDCEFAPMATESDQVVDFGVDEFPPGDSIGSCWSVGSVKAPDAVRQAVTTQRTRGAGAGETVAGGA